MIHLQSNLTSINLGGTYANHQ